MCYVCVDRWVWAEGGAQTEVEEALGIGGFGYPVSLIHICFSHSQTMQCHVIRDVLVRLEYFFLGGGGGYITNRTFNCISVWDKVFITRGRFGRFLLLRERT